MVFIVAEDEPIILEGEMSVLRKCQPDASIYGFSNAEQAIDHLKSEPADVAFLDIHLPGRSGLELAKEIKAVRPHINIIFVTAYEDHYKEAMNIHASGYILKPMTEEDVKAELSDLRYPLQHRHQGLFIRTFGDFEVFFNGLPIHFKYQKTKEFLAFLIDRRGSMVSNGECITILWEGQTGKTEYFKQLRKDLNTVLKTIGCEDILIKHRGEIGIVPERISCDLFYYTHGHPQGLNAYRGEYMNQYYWAESTRAALELQGDLWI